MAQCPCGRTWDYVEIDGFGAVSSLSGDIEMDGAIPIHTRTGLQGARCGRALRVIEMTSRQYFNSDFLERRDDTGTPVIGNGWSGARKGSAKEANE